MADDPTADATSQDASTSASVSDPDSAAVAPVPSSGSSSANMSSADMAATDQSTPDQSTVNQSTAASPSDTQPQPLQSIDPSAASSATVSGSAAGFAQITALAAGSDVASYNWQNRGRAPAGYIKGMAVAYARAYCKLKAGDAAATEVAKADTSAPDTDAISFYSDVFQAASMDNSSDGVDTLRHVYVLLTGLGMRESSGVYCEGRTSADNMSADTAEAGLFQVSFNASSASPLMAQLFTQYAGLTDFVDIFKEGVSCSSAKLQNFGSGDGAEFQRLTKACPAFAVVFAAVGLRNIRKHWGPINLKKAEVRGECDDLFTQVQNLVDQLQITAI